MSAVVEARQLAIARGRRRVLEGVDLAVSAGESVALLGANGSGKSSLLRVLAGIDAPAAGELRWAGGPLPAGPARCRRVGVVWQAETPPRFTVRDLVALGLGLDRAPRPSELARVDEVLARGELTRLAGRRCDRLSGGEWQRVALARALVAGPALLLLDEPSSHLDLGHRAALWRRLSRLRGQSAVVVATHELALAGACDRVLVLAGGRPWALGPPEATLTTGSLEASLGARVRVLADPGGGPPLYVPQTEERLR